MTKDDYRLWILLARGDKGFRHFLKYTLFEVEKCISNFESKEISRTLEKPDNYVIAKRIKSLYTEYIDGLSEEEKDAVKKIDMARSGMRNMRVSMVVYIRCAM